MNAITADEALAIAHPEWSNNEYHADRSAVSCSALKQILRSPAHMKAYYEKPNEETTSRLIGTALHAAVLEPEMFESTYVEWRGGNKTGKVYTAFLEENSGKSVLKSAEMTAVLRMRDSIMNYREYPIGELLRNGQNEQSIVWTDPETGVRCKIRPDNQNPYGTFDLKTTDDARPDAFVRNSVRMLYDLQAAMYQEGIFQTTGNRLDFFFIAVEDDAPHSTWVHKASDEMLASGMKKFRQALATYKRCLETGEYPDYETPCSIITWPSYA